MPSPHQDGGNQRIRLALIFGGRSGEHDVSVVSRHVDRIVCVNVSVDEHPAAAIEGELERFEAVRVKDRRERTGDRFTFGIERDFTE